MKTWAKRLMGTGFPGKAPIPLSAGLLVFALLWTSAWSQECPELAALPQPITVYSQPFPQSGLTVTNFSADWFESGGVSFFQISIDPSLQTVAANGGLKLGVLITGVPRGSGEAPAVLVDALYQVEPGDVGRMLTSEEVFDFQEVGSGTFVDENTLRDLSDNNGRLLPVVLDAKFRLTCQGQYTSQNWQEILTMGTVNPSNSFDGAIDPTLQVIDAVSPGNSNPLTPDVLADEFPNFFFNSSLSSQEIRYGSGETKFIIYLTEIHPGESPRDAVLNNNIPFMTILEGAPVNIATYPLSQPALKEEVLYGWRIAMRLRGPEDRLLYSEPLYFRYSKNPLLIPEDPLQTNKPIAGFVSLGDDYTRRLLAALKIILGDHYEIFLASLGNRVPVKGQIRWNGQPYSLEQLEKLAKTFAKRNNSLTRVRFRQ